VSVCPPLCCAPLAHAGRQAWAATSAGHRADPSQTPKALELLSDGVQRCLYGGILRLGSVGYVQRLAGEHERDPRLITVWLPHQGHTGFENIRLRGNSTLRGVRQSRPGGEAPVPLHYY
jgi:hypothetical protein